MDIRILIHTKKEKKKKKKATTKNKKTTQHKIQKKNLLIAIKSFDEKDFFELQF